MIPRRTGTPLILASLVVVSAVSMEVRAVTAAPSAQFRITPTGFDFREVGSTSASQRATVTNDGQVAGGGGAPGRLSGSR